MENIILMLDKRFLYSKHKNASCGVENRNPGTCSSEEYLDNQEVVLEDRCVLVPS